MKIILSIFIFVLLILAGTNTSFSADVTHSACSFSAFDGVDLITTSSVTCETPSGSQVWTNITSDCSGGNWENYELSAECETVATNCTERVKAPSTGAYNDDARDRIELSADFCDGGVMVATDCKALFVGSDVSNMYFIESCDDAGGAYTVYKRISGTDTSLGTFGSVPSGGCENILMYINIDDGIEICEAQAPCVTPDFTSSNSQLSVFDEAGICNGECTSSTGDDLAFANEFDNFLVESGAIPSTRNRFMIIQSLLDYVTQNAYAKKKPARTNDGRWYISPVVTHDGNRYAQSEVDLFITVNEMIQRTDKEGNPVGQPVENIGEVSDPVANCTNSNIISTADWALVYFSCDDYSKIDANPVNVFLADESLEQLESKFASMTGQKLTKALNFLSTKGVDVTGLNADSTLQEWFERIGSAIMGKSIDPTFTHVKKRI